MFNKLNKPILAAYSKSYHAQSYSPCHLKSNMHTDAKAWEVARNKAYRKLKGRVPPGWKLRIARKKFNSFYMAGKNATSSNERLWDDMHFVTATKYLGNKKEVGFPYLKCFIHPKEGPTWTLSNWGLPESMHRSANSMLSISQCEMEQVFKCMDALRDFMSNDPLVQLRANAKTDKIDKWSNLI